MLDKVEIVNLIAAHARSRGLLEPEYCRRYSFGFWAFGNSPADLIETFWDQPGKLVAYSDFDAIASDLIEMLPESDRDEETVHSVIETNVQGYDDLDRSRNRTILA